MWNFTTIGIDFVIFSLIVAKASIRRFLMMLITSSCTIALLMQLIMHYLSKYVSHKLARSVGCLRTYKIRYSVEDGTYLVYLLKVGYIEGK